MLGSLFTHAVSIPFSYINKEDGLRLKRNFESRVGTIERINSPPVPRIEINSHLKDEHATWPSLAINDSPYSNSKKGNFDDDYDDDGDGGVVEGNNLRNAESNQRLRCYFDSGTRWMRPSSRSCGAALNTNLSLPDSRCPRSRLNKSRSQF